MTVRKDIFLKGIGLLELMLVLAIISVMTIAAIRYFSIVSASNHIEQAIEMVSAVRAAGERWKVGNDNYSTLSATDGIGDFVDRGFLPSVYSSLKNPWGGTLSAAKSSTGGDMALDVKFGGVPTKTDCINFVNQIQSLGCTPTPAADSCADATDVTATC